VRASDEGQIGLEWYGERQLVQGVESRLDGSMRLNKIYHKPIASIDQRCSYRIFSNCASFRDLVGYPDQAGSAIADS
jgi:hypothetical protein